jgi:hypothetical protein
MEVDYLIKNYGHINTGFFDLALTHQKKRKRIIYLPPSITLNNIITLHQTIPPIPINHQFLLRSPEILTCDSGVLEQICQVGFNLNYSALPANITVLHRVVKTVMAEDKIMVLLKYGANPYHEFTKHSKLESVMKGLRIRGPKRYLVLIYNTTNLKNIINSKLLCSDLVRLLKGYIY